MPRKRTPTKPRLSRVTIRAERREQVDWDRFAYATLQYAKLVSQDPPRSAKAPKGRRP